MAKQLNGNVKWIMGIIAVIFTGLVLGFGANQQRVDDKLEERINNNNQRIVAIEKAMVADSVDKRYVKDKLIEINGKLDVLIKDK